MKKVLFFILSLLLLVCCFTGCRNKEEKGSKKLQYTKHDGYYSVSLGKCKDEDVVIPAEHKKLPVKVVDSFSNSTKMKSIVIPDSVTEIKANAFEACRELESIELSENITVIPYSAFLNCSSLKSIKIPQGVYSVQNNAFYGCNSLETVTFCNGIAGNYLAFIGYQAFAYCTSLKNVNFIETSKDAIINGQWSKLEKIGECAFIGCSSLESITIPGSVNKIEDYAFSGCSNLKDITLENGVDSIGSKAFSKCTSLTSIYIPNSVTDIGSLIFAGCNNLSELTVSGNTCSLKEMFDREYTGSLQLYLNSYDIVESFFDDFNKLKYNEYNNACYVGSSYNPYAVLVKVQDPSATSLEIHKNTEVIYSKSLSSGLTSITIPAYVNNIYGDAFKKCSSLLNIEVDDKNSTYTDIDGNLYTKDGETLVEYARGKNKTSFVIPDGVTSIGDYAFYGCAYLSSISIPSGVVSIGDHAFEECSNLNNITIPEGITTIGDHAFRGCKALKNITIPAGVTVLGDYIFTGCSSLESVSIPEGVVTIGDYAFARCEALKTIIIPDSVTSIGKDAFENCSNLISNISGIDYVGKWIVGCNSNISELNILTDTKGIAPHAFVNCKNITSVTLPDGITTIGHGAFAGCSNLENVIIPNSVTKIGDEAFGSCTKLKLNEYNGGYYVGNNENPYLLLIKVKLSDNSTRATYEIHEKTKFIHSDAFVADENVAYGSVMGTIFGCHPIERIVLPSGLKGIGDNAFIGCGALKSINIPASVENVGENAFVNNDDQINTLTIYCEANSQPAEWDSEWNPNGCRVIWGSKGK